MKRQIRFSKRLGIGFLLAAICFVGLAVYSVMPPVPPWKMNAISQGMSRQDVLERLGAPASEVDHGTTLRYERYLQFGYLDVHLSDDNTVEYLNFERF